MLVELLLFLAILALARIYFGEKTPDFPPGPSAKAVLNSLLFLAYGRPIQEIAFHASKLDGPLVGLQLGPLKVVFVNGYETVKEVLAREDCSFRPDNIILKMRSFNKKLGIIFADGNIWRTHRRFAIRHLRDFGFGKSSTERMIRDEAEALVESMKKRAGCPEGSALHDLLPISVINVLWAMMSGQRHDHEDAQFKQLLENITAYTRQGDPLRMILPWLRFIPVINRPIKEAMKSAEILQDYIKGVAEQHEATYEEGVTRDFIDVYISAMRKGEDPSFDMEQLIVVCMDLFLGGTDTTSNALSFALLYLAVFPRVQDKLRAEMERISPGGEPPLTDVPNCHYYQAFVQELLRHVSMVPILPPHTVINDITLRSGHHIPKDTMFIVNLYSVSMDKSHWLDPENFRPERFLDENGVYERDPCSIPFGQGPRQCLGEPLSKDTMFIILTSLLHRFKFSVPATGPLPTLEPKQGLVLSPKEYKLYVEEI
ncbi:Hypothetical predicted protein [Cloeon dipterum]|uniref:Cytochrome P450 n=1 Tax=Cloeon dipterum TaxID=197152 RepID=A0A8S1CXU4_9INSE|nr:Hypothetical predicted protein [Cloeon dipterum]